MKDRNTFGSKPRSRADRIQAIVVDDSQVMRKHLRDFLTECSSVELVAEATNGAEAVELAVRRQPDLVIMDLNMPTMDGLQATGLIRERNPEARIIIMTMAGGNEVKARCLAGGAHGFVCKQQICRELRAIISRLFPALGIKPSLLEEGGACV